MMAESNNKLENRKGNVKKDCAYCKGQGEWSINGLFNPCMCTKVKHSHSDGINNLVINSVINISKQAVNNE
jgi:hypothetical protein